MMETGTAALELPEGLEWVNTEHAPALTTLRGRVVLLLFWTYDNANSLNALEEVRALEQRFADGLSVIGVHTPRYAGQRQAAAVAKAVNRLGLRFPVANDPGYVLWQRLGLRAWPSQVLVDVDGSHAGLYAGEQRGAELAARIAQMLEQAARRDQRMYEPWPEAVRPEPRLPLAFPARVLATEQRLYIADSGHHRVLETGHDGRILRQFGSGSAALADGRGGDAAFRAPQGLCLQRDHLYVADTGNHAIRRVRLQGGEVDTVAGGRLGRDRPHDHAEPTQVAMCQPSDVAADGEALYCSVAGQNQVWRLDLAQRRLDVFAGSGQFGMVDGDGPYASFAHPAGLALLGEHLVVADAGACAIRRVRLADAHVDTVVGGGPFEFGDSAGKGAAVRLQHPLGVCSDPRGLVFIADSYNDRIKALNLRSGEVRAFNLPHRFQQPEGIALAAGALWIANTNAHEIVRVDLATGACRRVPVGE